MPAIDAAPAASVITLDTFDLSNLRQPPDAPGFGVVRPRCTPGGTGEIVVCAPDPEKQRVRPLPEGYDIPDAPPRAAVKLGENTTADVHLQSEVFPNGMISNRLMVGLTTKF